MKLIIIAILSTIAEAIAVKVPGGDFPSDQWTWEQTGGTRMFMKNTPVEENQQDDTRMFMNNIAINPNGDYSENLRILGMDSGATTPVTGPNMDEKERKVQLATLTKTCDDLLNQMRETVSGDQVDLSKYIPLRTSFNDILKQIKEVDVEGTMAFILSNFTRYVPRIDSVAKEMCKKSYQIECESV